MKYYIQDVLDMLYLKSFKSTVFADLEPHDVELAILLYQEVSGGLPYEIEDLEGAKYFYQSLCNNEVVEGCDFPTKEKLEQLYTEEEDMPEEEEEEVDPPENLFRFMSMKEFELLCSGATLTNENDHANCRTDSVGFCFLEEKFDSFYLNDICPEFAFDFLSGIVSDEICVRFKVVDSSVLKRGYGEYSNPCSSWGGTMKIREYSTPKYSRKELVPIEYAAPNYGTFEWKKIN